MLSKKQNSWYWREWSKVHKTDPTLDRHALHISALGYDKSHTAFTNEELDLVLAEFLCISEPANLDMQVRLLRQPKTRLIHKIARLAPPAYVKELLRDRWGTEDINDLDVSDLHQLRNTLKARSNALRHRAEQPDHPEPAEALADNRPF